MRTRTATNASPFSSPATRGRPGVCREIREVRPKQPLAAGHRAVGWIEKTRCAWGSRTAFLLPDEPTGRAAPCPWRVSLERCYTEVKVSLQFLVGFTRSVGISPVTAHWFVVPPPG